MAKRGVACSKVPLWTIVLLMCVALIVIGCESGPPKASGGKASVGSGSFSGKKLEVIKADGVYLMSGPSLGSSKVLPLERGASIEVTKREGDWIAVTTMDGKDGWVHGGYVTGFSISKPD